MDRTNGVTSASWSRENDQQEDRNRERESDRQTYIYSEIEGETYRQTDTGIEIDYTGNDWNEGRGKVLENGVANKIK